MKVLIAVDQSDATNAAVEFAARMFAHQADGGASLTLFHVVESLPDELLVRADAAEHSDAYREVCTDWEAAGKANGDRLLKDHKTTLVQSGVPETTVNCKLVVRESRPGAGKVIASLAIIEEMRAEDYDVVCLGRRGASGAAGSFLGSVAEKVLREAQGRTVWVVD